LEDTFRGWIQVDLSKLEGKRFYGKARTQFLAHKDSIAAAIAQGYPLSVIWETMRAEGLFDAKYIQFVRYVNSLLHAKNERQKPSGKPELKKTPDEDRAAATPAPDPKESNGLEKPREKPKGGFTVDPDRPKRAAVEMPKPFKWNPIPLTEEEIRTGRITSR
jgi:hypothetical protein